MPMLGLAPTAGASHPAELQRIVEGRDAEPRAQIRENAFGIVDALLPAPIACIEEDR